MRWNLDVIRLALADGSQEGAPGEDDFFIYGHYAHY